MPENQKDADSASVRQLPRPVWILRECFEIAMT